MFDLPGQVKVQQWSGVSFFIFTIIPEVNYLESQDTDTAPAQLVCNLHCTLIQTARVLSNFVAFNHNGQGPRSYHSARYYLVIVHPFVLSSPLVPFPLRSSRPPFRKIITTLHSFKMRSNVDAAFLDLDTPADPMETTNKSSDAAAVARQGFMASLALMERIVNGDHLAILDMDITAVYDAIDTVATEYWKGTVRDSPPHLPPDAREASIDDLPDCSPTEFTKCMLLYMITYT
ncbi:hypothetical protein DPV78_010565 [Talaromyces pinophilus]|nr:hypothetical protein DPV78_010565 [Talaromyces pinophilus]